MSSTSSPYVCPITPTRIPLLTPSMETTTSASFGGLEVSSMGRRVTSFSSRRQGCGTIFPLESASTPSLSITSHRTLQSSGMECEQQQETSRALPKQRPRKLLKLSPPFEVHTSDRNVPPYSGCWPSTSPISSPSSSHFPDSSSLSSFHMSRFSQSDHFEMRQATIIEPSSGVSPHVLPSHSQLLPALSHESRSSLSQLEELNGAIFSSILNFLDPCDVIIRLQRTSRTMRHRISRVYECLQVTLAAPANLHSISSRRMFRSTRTITIRNVDVPILHWPFPKLDSVTLQLEPSICADPSALLALARGLAFIPSLRHLTIQSLTYDSSSFLVDFLITLFDLRGSLTEVLALIVPYVHFEDADLQRLSHVFGARCHPRQHIQIQAEFERFDSYGWLLSHCKSLTVLDIEDTALRSEEKAESRVWEFGCTSNLEKLRLHVPLYGPGCSPLRELIEQGVKLQSLECLGYAQPTELVHLPKSLKHISLTSTDLIPVLASCCPDLCTLEIEGAEGASVCAQRTIIPHHHHSLHFSKVKPFISCVNQSIDVKKRWPRLSSLTLPKNCDFFSSSFCLHEDPRG